MYNKPRCYPVWYFKTIKKAASGCIFSSRSIFFIFSRVLRHPLSLIRGIPFSELPHRVILIGCYSRLLLNCERILNVFRSHYSVVTWLLFSFFPTRMICQNRMPTPRQSTTSPMLAYPSGIPAGPSRITSPRNGSRVEPSIRQYA